MLYESPHGQQDDRDIEELIIALRNEDGDTRAMAAQTLGKQRNRQAVEPLIAALNDPHYWLVRCNAAEALGKIGDLRAVEPLIASLTHLDVNTQAAAAEALGNLGDPRAIEALTARLRVGTDAVFKASAEALDKLGGSTIVMAEQAVKAKREKRRIARSASVKMMRRGGALILITLSLGSFIIRFTSKFVPPGYSYEVVSDLYVLIIVLLVLIGALAFAIGFFRWLWLNRP